MLNASHLIADRTEAIMEQWLEAVRKDRQVESTVDLSDTALGNSLPKLLKSLAAVLAHSQEDVFERIREVSLEHGNLRASQGYDPAEIMKEYNHLRRIILLVLEPHCLEGSPQEIIQTFHEVDTVLDEAIAQCYKGYVEERVQELEKIQSQLTLTNQELTRLFEANRDHLSYMAHELKTPLTSVIGYADLLLRLQKQNLNAESDSLNIRSIERVLQGGRHLLHIVNDALELSRYEANQIKLNLEWIDVCSVISTVYETVEPLAQAKGLELKIDGNCAPDRVLTDSFRLQQILTNLLSNAIRYTEEGLIQVSCQTRSDDTWSFCVTDTGIGIAPEDQKHIFEPYSQAFKPGRQKQEGIGLGLAIVSRVIKTLQGDIQLASEVGVGSTFTVILPITIQVDG